jgi:hypothetical protein
LEFSLANLIEYINPTGHTVVLSGPNGEQIQLRKFEKRILSEYYKRYIPRYLKVVQVLVMPELSKPLPPSSSPPPPPSSPRVGIRAQPLTKTSSNKQHLRTIVLAQANKQHPPITPHIVLPRATAAPPLAVISQSIAPRSVTVPRFVAPRSVTAPRFSKSRLIVGRANMMSERAMVHFKELLTKIQIPISNDIGIGILSFNRVTSLTRLVDSIRKNTDLSRTTVFISDESTDSITKDYIRTIKDMMVLDNSERIGIAGNSNRLLRCLERFRFKILLNDDVEILSSGWDQVYAHATATTGIHHFCMRQPGVCGAGVEDGIIRDIKGIQVRTILSKPQGAVLAFDHIAFSTVGYFDEELFKFYGMEHVDWSNRVALSGIQLPGFHDVIGSEGFFHIHKEHSVVEERGVQLACGRQAYEAVKEDHARIKIQPSSRSEVPKISCVIPFRLAERSDAIKMSLQNIKAQKFPQIEIIMVEQDDQTRYQPPEFQSIVYILARANQPFTKALAMNVGVSQTTASRLILHDADILVPDDYIQFIYNLLNSYEGAHVGKNVLYLINDATTQLINTGKLAAGMNLNRSVGYFEGGSLGCYFNSYLKIGGFCEEFMGYGNEDTEFFDRLKSNVKFYNERTVDFIHTHHGRSGDWKLRHEQNKRLEQSLRALPMTQRINRMCNNLAKYKLIPR